MFGVGLAVAVLRRRHHRAHGARAGDHGLLGDANWWLPGWLDRILPHLDLEGSSVLGAVDEMPSITVPDDLSELDDDKEVVLS